MAGTFQKHTHIISLYSLQSCVKIAALTTCPQEIIIKATKVREREKELRGPGKLLMLTQPSLQHKYKSS